MLAYLSLILAQAFYTASDTWKKIVFGAHGFTPAAFVKPVFLAALVVAAVGFLFQMHALARLDLSRTIVTMGMLAIVFSTAAGAVFFKESLSAWNYLGLAFALAAVWLVNVK
jgi:drug/metabolite transporter (DMT)-like permease